MRVVCRVARFFFIEYTKIDQIVANRFESILSDSLGGLKENYVTVGNDLVPAGARLCQ
jgi:hypothetical protein